MSDSKLKRPIGSIILDVVSFIARFYMAYIWIKAGWHKIGNHMNVMQSIQGYDIFTEQWAGYLARAIGPLEIAGGVMLLLGLFLRFSGILSTIVLCLFIVGIAQAWARGIVTDCGCFGNTDVDSNVGMDYAKTIARDAFYIFLSMWTVFRPFKKFALHA